jgi:membrane protease YdiL (CAAX protease family)
MTSPRQGVSRVRAYVEFVAAVLYFIFAKSLAGRLAARHVSDAWFPLVDQAILALLLVCGYAVFGSLFDRERNSISAQGLPLRVGWAREAGAGIAIGWTAVVVCVLPLTLFGGIAVVLSTQLSSWGWLLADAAFFAIAAFAEEVAFRGYGFQRFERVVGKYGAALGFAAFYAIVQTLQPGSGSASIAVSVAFGLLLSTAYLRTRALWLSWGLNFAWKASRALIFGLAVSGVNSHSSVVEGDPMGPLWLTGGGYGLDGSWLAVVVLLLVFPLVYRVTRDLNFRYNVPEVVPGGIPVDIDAAARLQHESATRHAEPEEKAASSLVQILPLVAPPSSIPASNPPVPQVEDSH